MKSAAEKADIPGVQTMLFGAPEGQDARLLATRARALANDRRVVVHVAVDDTRASTLQSLLSFFAPDVEVLYLPAWDCLPYDRIAPHKDIVSHRVATLAALIGWNEDGLYRPRILLTTVNAVAQRLMPREKLKNAALTIKKGGRADLSQLQTFLHDNGYLRTDTVRESGEYALRGGIVDLFPPGYEEPLRLDLFGDDVESIASFDPESQRSIKKIDQFSLHPATEFFFSEQDIAHFRTRYRDLFGGGIASDPLYTAVSEGRRYNGMEHWIPLFFDGMDTLDTYVPNAFITLDPNGAQALAERRAQVDDFYKARRTLEQSSGKKKKESDVSLTGSAYHPLPPALLYLDDDESNALTARATQLSGFGGTEGAEDGQGRKGRDFADARAQPGSNMFSAVAEYIQSLRGNNRKIMIAAYSEGSRERLRGVMESSGFANLKLVNNADDIRKLESYETGLTILPLEQGFTAPDLAVLTEQDILGDRLARRPKSRKKADNFLKEVSALSPGDLVVHIDHGVGRFESLETIKAGGVIHDCLKIIYAGDDRLFVPVENIEVLSRFGSDEGMTQLDKMGGAGWQARKARVKKDLMIMAGELLKIAAARQLQKADVLSSESINYADFVGRFPYQETDDQARSINDVVGDLVCGRPMDRLVCGDVGFGKTEVALRAAYIAAKGGAQVAVVVPTTLLARQHYKNFSERFSGTGLRVAHISRLVPAKEQKKTHEGLADGTVDIVIGTHALLADSVKFGNLGLLIVDEEQRFGVKQKEKLKTLRASVHILTLTATPIPRTLQMALTGVRDLSLIATPPVDRLAIRTFVLPFDPVVVRDAIMREHYRGGQTFYVVPRIADLVDVEQILRDLVPEIKVISAHGQMSATELEDRMSAFYDGQYDMLLVTNIIESGLDIPRANTMIIHRADLFGLSQMYQIRGRIGRSKVRAYAYLTHDPAKKLTPNAMKRLEVIETLDTLGAGFQLASHDMDIRGAGNLLGDEQSGHIREVGVELYQQMLEEAVAAAREGLDITGAEAAPDSWSPVINLGASVLIPEIYVEDLNVRMSLYRRLSDMHEKNEIESFAAELIDRFGPLPDEVENLLKIMEIKQLCRAAGIDKVDAGPKGAVISFYKDTPPNPAGVMAWIQKKAGAVRLRPDQKIVAVRSWDSVDHRVTGVRSILKDLTKIS